jgi:hypothetical protein
MTSILITIKVPPQTHRRLYEQAKAKGYSASAYAQMLFDAAFAARMGQLRDDPVGDAELDEQVWLVFACAGQGDVAAIAKATGVKQTLVAKILAGWKQAGRA